MQHLYVFALNGLMKVIKLVKYVDDTFVSLFYKNDVVSKLEHWYKSSFLLINAEKTKELILNHADPPPLLTLGDQSVEIVNCQLF